MTEIIDIAEADARIDQCVAAAPVIRCPLAKAAGRVLREPIEADRPLPPFNRVMMDGFAIRFRAIREGVVLFRVRGRAMAGEDAKELPAEIDAAIEVTTGAPLPIGADVVVPYEDTHVSGHSFCVDKQVTVEPDQYVHQLGSDYPQGATLAAAGCLLGPVELGIAASCGYAELAVSANARIAVAGTGDELVPINTQPAPHQIRASNATAIESALGLAGFSVGQVLHWPDELEAGRDALTKALAEVDVLVIAGAVSKGVRDWVPTVLDEVAEKQFHGVRQRPGKPMGLWKTASGQVIFALPGNPVSALVGAHRHVIPYLAMREGGGRPKPTRVKLSEGITFDPPLTWFLPVAITEDGLAEPKPVNNSGDYARLHGTDGFVELAAAHSEWTAGVEVPFYHWSR